MPHAHSRKSNWWKKRKLRYQQHLDELKQIRGMLARTPKVWDREIGECVALKTGDNDFQISNIIYGPRGYRHPLIKRTDELAAQLESEETLTKPDTDAPSENYSTRKGRRLSGPSYS